MLVHFVFVLCFQRAPIPFRLVRDSETSLSTCCYHLCGLTTKSVFLFQLLDIWNVDVAVGAADLALFRGSSHV